ncbi:MAG: DUF2019 domain-containing protein [Rhizobiaceae bacterium]
MSRHSLSSMISSDLISLFVKLSREQGEAQIDLETRKYNRLFDQVKAIETELRARPDRERMVLHGLLDHPNPKVRMNAAYALLDIAKDDAFAALKSVAESRYYPFNADARGSVEAIEEDDFPRGSNPNSRFR